MNPKEMTGLQLLQAMCAGKIPPASISETIPMQPYEVSEGTIHFKVKADHRHLNPLGGRTRWFLPQQYWIPSPGCAVHSMLEAGVGYGTIDLNIKMCRPTPKELYAVGTIINISKNLGISEGKIIDEYGNLYTHATATCMIIR